MMHKKLIYTNTS